MQKKLEKFGVTMHKKTLTSGVNLFLFERKGMPISLRATFFAGSRFDKIPGTAHFLEHMLVAGSQKFPTKDLLSQEIEKIGGEFKASTNADLLRIYIDIPEKSDIEKGVEILNECLHPLFDLKTVETERGAILSELRSKKTNPKDYIWDVQKRLFLQNTPVANNTLGSEEDIKSINLETLKFHFDEHIHTGNLCIIASGDIDIENLAVSVEKKLSLAKKDKFSLLEKLPISLEKKREVETYPGLKQLQVVGGFRTKPENYDEECALRVLSSYLGGGRSSRLNTELRYKNGFVYSVNAVSFIGSDWSVLRVSFSGLSENLDKILQIIFTEFEEIQKNLKDDDIAITKARLEKIQLLWLQTSESWIDFHETDCLFRPEDVHTPEDFQNTLNTVNAKNVQVAVNKYFNKDSFLVAICGDIKN